MNNCILIAKIIRAPELRYTQDTQTPISQILVEFEGQRPEDPLSTLKVVGWGNLASEIQENYTEGDRVIIEGRLSMSTFERPEGFKEKRAELTVSRIYKLDGSTVHSSSQSVSTPASDKVVGMDSYKSSAQKLARKQEIETVEASASDNFSPPEKVTATKKPVSTPSEQDLDDIPFVRPIYSRTNWGHELNDSWELAVNHYWEGIK